MDIHDAGGIPYVLVLAPAAPPCDAYGQKEMLTRLKPAIHAALLGMGSEAVLLMGPDVLAAFGVDPNDSAFCVNG